MLMHAYYSQNYSGIINLLIGIKKLGSVAVDNHGQWKGKYRKSLLVQAFL